MKRYRVVFMFETEVEWSKADAEAVVARMALALKPADTRWMGAPLGEPPPGRLRTCKVEDEDG